ncbi:Segregation and condensation protein A [Chlamydiales bacterium SCGC AG-110-P3]|nr:Segregation and condensation protein A [Chlamydiales bacterium SCGC AG-110-P3]
MGLSAVKRNPPLAEQSPPWYNEGMFHPAEQETYNLDVFEGPLDFLVHLIQRKEVDIHDVTIRHIIEQYVGRLETLTKEEVDKGAEFIGITASLVYLKSKMLLPAREQSSKEDSDEEDELDPRFEVIHHLLDYCRFKDAAKLLSQREDERSGIYHRGLEGIPIPEQTLGIEHLSFEDLEALFEDTLARAEARSGDINEEKWRVSDKARWLRRELKQRDAIPFAEVFSSQRSRGELVVSFLAVLEMMKIGVLWVGCCSETQEVKIFRGEENEETS